ncbi:tetratricopeptide repeat protein [Rhizobium sp. CAU 1783]
MLDLSKFPEPFHDCLRQALTDWGVRALTSRKELGGKSGAYVWLIDIETSKYNGPGILKFANKELIETELSNHQIASNCTPKNAIPEVVATFRNDTQSAFLMSVAGDGLLEVDTLSEIPSNKLNVSLATAAREILAVWNGTSNFEHARESVSDVLRSLVQRQMGVSSRIPQFMLEYAGLPENACAFRYNGQDYPNPMVFGDPRTPGGQIDLATIRGAVHGDFHPGNILLARYGEKPSVHIIDFEKFNPKACLFFDHAYLELSFLLMRRQMLPPQRWSEICRDLKGIEKSQDGLKASAQDDIGLLFSVGALRYEINDWSRTKFPQRTEDLKKQVLVARIAAGLDFCNKKSLDENKDLSDKKKFFAFIYAAEAAKSLLEYSRIEIPEDGVLISAAAEKPLPKSDHWKDAWERCGKFDEGKSCFILLSDQYLAKRSEFSQKIISRLPWSLIIDLATEGLDSPFAKSGVPLVQQQKTVTHLLPHQVQPGDNLSSSLCWLAANAPREDGSSPPISLWRKETLQVVRKLVNEVYHANTPKPITLVMLGDDGDTLKKKAIAAAVEEVAAGYVRTIFVSDAYVSSSYSHLKDELESSAEIKCDFDDFCLGIYQIVGDLSQRKALWIPARSDDGTKKLELLSSEDAALFRGAVELVPASPSLIGSASDNDSGFLQGGIVDWDDLDARRDVDRDVTRQLVQHLRTRLTASPNESYSINHSPGAGGTTVARRAAWELRDEFPAFVIASFSKDVIEVLDFAFRLTSLPLLIILEATTVTAGQRDFLYTELRGRNVRFLILDVRRHQSPKTTDAAVALKDPMTLNEAQRFFRVFSMKASSDRKEKLRSLATDREFEFYRSPFFFGLYSFEGNFKKIPDFVAGCLDNTPRALIKPLCQLALVSRYSQERIPLTALNVMMGIEATSSAIDLQNILGDGPERLIIITSHGVGIKHPLLAEEMLRQHLKPLENTNPDAWIATLNEFCIDFINDIVRLGLEDNSKILEILYDLFLERQSSEGAGKSRFSELIELLGSPYGERRVLEALVSALPDNPFFLSHLARHMNYRRSGSFEEAERTAKQAIILDETNDEPYHILGMIYRFEIERRLQVDTVVGLDVDGLVGDIDDLFTKARSAFEKSLQLSMDSNFPLITPIQMTIHTLSRIFSLSRSVSFVRFLAGNTYAAFWCREKLDYTQSLFHELHRLEAVSDPSERRVRCDADYQELLGNMTQVVSELSALLKRPDVRKGPIRRLISSAYFRDISFWTKQKNISVYREIVSLCEDNLLDDPSSTVDLRLWLRAYRMLPDASITLAIEKFNRATLLTDNVEPRYYLMILHFVAHRLGFPGSLLEAKKYQDYCRQHSTSSVGKKSLEWLAKPALGRPIPLLHHTELGDWDRQRDFFSNATDLDQAEGRIDEIRSLQAGTILVSGMPAFFAPRAEFRKLTDTNATVSLSLGFSYEGLRAWNVHRI